MHRPASFILIGIGLAAGIFSGLFGVGGGILMVPAMVLFAAFLQQRAQATSLAAIVPIAAVGALIFGRTDNLDLLAAAMLVAGSLLGVQLGTRLMHRLSNERLSTIFGLYVAIVGVVLLVQ